MPRKLNVGDTLSEVFATYGANAGLLLPLAFWLYLVVAIVNGVVGNSLAGFAIALVFGSIVGFLYEGMVVGLVRDVQNGRRDSSAGDLYQGALPVLAPLIGAGLLYGIGVVIGFALLVVPGLFLITIWAVIAPAIVIERCGVRESFERSRELVRGNGWPVLWVVLVAFLIAAAGAVIFGDIAVAIADGPIVRIVFSALASTITAPISALVAAVLYYRLLAIQGGPSTDAG
ncbi:MAG TPA: hypothetical protein VMT37_00065 [Solirubrobacterales bacterium]|nr:hypothetical protein [Solirubrobacterales bacterium]